VQAGQRIGPCFGPAGALRLRYALNLLYDIHSAFCACQLCCSPHPPKFESFPPTGACGVEVARRMLAVEPVLL
jgi:hypothetical protein